MSPRARGPADTYTVSLGAGGSLYTCAGPFSLLIKSAEAAVQ